MATLTKHNWHEPVAYVTAALFLFLGMAFTCSEAPSAINRAGSLIIVVGIVLALSRKYDVLYDEVLRLVATTKDLSIEDVFQSISHDLNLSITEPRKAEIKNRLAQEIQGDFNAVFAEKRRIFKLHEASLVVMGTLINGFGDVALASLLG